MIQLDSQTLKMKWQILQRKIRQVRKTMDKLNTNLCEQELLEGQGTCGGEYLMTENIEWCKKLNIPFLTKGVSKDIQKAKEENLKFKKTLWWEDYKEIRTEMDRLSKVKDLKMPTAKRETI